MESVTGDLKNIIEMSDEREKETTHTHTHTHTHTRRRTHARRRRVRLYKRSCRVSEIRIVGSKESRSHIPGVGMA